MARRLMAGHRSLEPAVVVRIHPGQSSVLASAPPLQGRFSGSGFARGSLLLVLASFTLLSRPCPATARQDPRHDGVAERDAGVDSVALIRKAREAQKRFERLHRNHLPRSSTLWQGGCDERLGQMCLRFDASRVWKPGPEDPEVTTRREELLELLGGVGTLVPGDRWVMAQRIRYLGDLSRWSEALTVARGCAGDPEWWCAALRGYVHHRSGRILEAEEAFGESLDLMPPERASQWKDPRILLDYQGTQWLKSPGLLSPEMAIQRFWTLADPLFLTPGNERLTEHFARRFAASLLQDSELTLGVDWEEHLETILVRYGFGVGWERSRPGIGEAGGGGVVEHHHPDSRGLLPPAEALADPSGLPEGIWVPQDRHPRSASAPVPATLLVDGRAATAVFRREGDLLVVASYDAPVDTLLRNRSPGSPGNGGKGGVLPPFGESLLAGASTDTLSGMFLLPDTGAWAPLGVIGTGGRGVLQLRAPPGRYLLSVESWNPVGRWGARVRHGIVADEVPPDVPVLSDLVLLDPASEVPEALEDALPWMRAGLEVTGEEKVGVGWEVYGLGFRQETLTFRLRLIREEESIVRRALERLGLFDREPILTLSWGEEEPVGTGPLFRAVELDLPSMDPGRYVLQLELDIPGRTRVLSHRRLIVR